MECYRVHIPIGTRVPGITASGHPACVLPGEYVAHRLPARLTRTPEVLLRLVGADPAGRDVHVSLPALRRFARKHHVSVSRLEESELGEAA